MLNVKIRVNQRDRRKIQSSDHSYNISGPPPADHYLEKEEYKVVSSEVRLNCLKNDAPEEVTEVA